MLQQRAVPKESPLQLVVPSLAHLDAYADALRRGWSPDNVRLAEAAREELEWIAEDRAAFVAMLEDREAKRGPITLPDGSQVPRLPGYRRWMWDGEFCGSIGFRWQPGTSALPPYVPGPYRLQRRAVEAAAAATPRGRWRCCCRKRARRASTMSSSTTDPDNLPSQKVITANGGALVKRFRKEPAYGQAEALLFRIPL